MFQKLIPLTAAIAFVAGCTSTPKEEIVEVEENDLFLHAEVAGANIPDDHMARLRYGESLKAYSVGRYVDPNDTSLMHERSVIYRVERMPRWNLRPNTPVASGDVPYLYGNRSLDMDPDVTDAMIAEFETDLQGVQQLQQKVGRDSDRLSSAIQKVNKASKVLIDSNVNTVRTREAVKQVSSSVAKIAQRLQELKREAEKLSEGQTALQERVGKIEKENSQVFEPELPKETDTFNLDLRK